MSLFLGASWRPRWVCFSHGAPADRSAHHRIFGEHLLFNHEFNGLLCNRTDLDQPNPGADPMMVRYAQALIANKPAHPPRFSQQVESLILLLLPRGQCRAEVVAQHLGCDRRTVTRRLALERTGFFELMNAHRRHKVVQYLQDRNRPLAEVAQMLGFSSPSAFSRWFRTEFGQRARDFTAQN